MPPSPLQSGKPEPGGWCCKSDPSHHGSPRATFHTVTLGVCCEVSLVSKLEAGSLSSCSGTNPGHYWRGLWGIILRALSGRLSGELSGEHSKEYSLGAYLGSTLGGKHLGSSIGSTSREYWAHAWGALSRSTQGTYLNVLRAHTWGAPSGEYSREYSWGAYVRRSIREHPRRSTAFVSLLATGFTGIRSNSTSPAAPVLPGSPQDTAIPSVGMGFYSGVCIPMVPSPS